MHCFLSKLCYSVERYEPFVLVSQASVLSGISLNPAAYAPVFLLYQALIPLCSVSYASYPLLESSLATVDLPDVEIPVIKIKGMGKV